MDSHGVEVEAAANECSIGEPVLPKTEASARIAGSAFAVQPRGQTLQLARVTRCLRVTSGVRAF